MKKIIPYAVMLTSLFGIHPSALAFPGGYPYTDSEISMLLESADIVEKYELFSKDDQVAQHEKIAELKTCMDKGNGWCATELGHTLFERRDFPLALKMFKKSSELLHGNCDDIIGDIYLNALDPEHIDAMMKMPGLESILDKYPGIFIDLDQSIFYLEKSAFRMEAYGKGKTANEIAQAYSCKYDKLTSAVKMQNKSFTYNLKGTKKDCLIAEYAWRKAAHKFNSGNKKYQKLSQEKLELMKKNGWINDGEKLFNEISRKITKSIEGASK